MSQDGININGPQMSLKHLRRFALDNTGRGEWAFFDLPNGKRISMKIGWFTTSYTLDGYSKGVFSSRLIQEPMAEHYVNGMLKESRKPELGSWIIVADEDREDCYTLQQDEKPVAKELPKAPEDERFIVHPKAQVYRRDCNINAPSMRGYHVLASFGPDSDFSIDELVDPNRTAMDSRPRASWSVEELGTLTFSELMELVKDGEIGPNVARAAILCGPRLFTGLTPPAPGSEYALQCSPMLLREEIDCLNRANRQHAETIEQLRELNARRGSLIQHLISIMEIEQEDEADLPQAVMSLKRWAVSLEQQRNKYGSMLCEAEQRALELELRQSEKLDAKVETTKGYMSIDEVLELQAERQRKLEQRRADAKARR